VSAKKLKQAARGSSDERCTHCVLTKARWPALDVGTMLRSSP